MAWQLINFGGQFGITLGWTPEGDLPMMIREVYYNPKVEWDNDYHSQFTQVRLIENHYFLCFSNRTYTELPLDTNHWEHVRQSEPIKPPSRGGKGWKWEWSSYSEKYIKKYQED